MPKFRVTADETWERRAVYIVEAENEDFAYDEITDNAAKHTPVEVTENLNWVEVDLVSKES